MIPDGDAANEGGGCVHTRLFSVELVPGNGQRHRSAVTRAALDKDAYRKMSMPLAIEKAVPRPDLIADPARETKPLVFFSAPSKSRS